MTDPGWIWAAVAGPLVVAVLLDGSLGDPPERSWAERWYPPVLVGRLASALERRVSRENPQRERAAGTVLWFVLVLGTAGGAGLLTFTLGRSAAALGGTAGLAWLVFAIALTLTIVWLKSTFAVRTLVAFCSRPLDQPLPAMRSAVGQVVNRPVDDLPVELLCSALIESAADNTTDSVVAPILTYALLGLPGAVAYRTANTLDALWGHTERRWKFFGATAAVADRWWNALPDRMTAALFWAAAGRAAVRPALDRVDPAMPVAASLRCLSGLLRVRLERRGSYVIGADWPYPSSADVRRALVLVRRASALAVIIALAISAGLADVGWTFFLR